MIYRADLLPGYLKYKDELNDAVFRVLNSGRYILSDEVMNFEKEFAAYNDAKYCLGVASGTDAIILALKAYGIGFGDEVITTAYTAYPTISAIITSGAKPVFVDVCEDTYLIDIDKVSLVITSNTKAIIPVHLFGNVVDIEKLRKTVGDDIYILEDAAQAHGSMIDNQKAGSMGDLGCFSFYPSKNLGGYGDGGAIITNSKDIYEKLQLMRNYGMRDKDHVDLHGLNSRLDEIQAAILRVKLKYLDVFNMKRNLIAKNYYSSLDDSFFSHQKIGENVYSNFHIFQPRFSGNRSALIEFLNKKGIQTNIYYLFPHHLQRSLLYLNYSVGDMPNAENLSHSVIALPLYPEIKSSQVDKVVSVINNFCKECKFNA